MLPELEIFGGAAGILAFIVAILKIFQQDKVWRDLIENVRTELKDCREQKGKLEAKVQTLEGEIMQLRRDVNYDYWLSISPKERHKHFDQELEGGE
jgi:hypothetical protein